GAFDDDDVNTLPEPGNPGLYGHTAITMETSGSSGSVGCWKLDETSGLTAADSSGSGNNGTLVNGPTWNPTGGQIGGALAFDGTDDYVNLGTDSSLNFGSAEPFTIAAWVKTTENYGMIVSFRSSTDGGPVIDLAVGYEGAADNPGKAMILVRQNGGGGYAQVIGGSVKDGLWHHVVGVRGSGSTIELFLDGVSQGTASGTESGGAITTNLRAIGSERRWVSDGYGTSDQRYLAGTIDDVRIYNRALSAGEIATLYSGGELGGSGEPVSGGAGYVRQATAGGSETSNFTLGSANEARTLTIAIAPADASVHGCCGDLQP
ncbi:MAG: LamG domain-containing protein, partial [Planctomycetes bacterium]|nr:LamG domain-containing protein [Planctomycetota bacterium]